jgi:hypothetical protein
MSPSVKAVKAQEKMLGIEMEDFDERHRTRSKRCHSQSARDSIDCHRINSEIIHLESLIPNNSINQPILFNNC